MRLAVVIGMVIALAAGLPGSAQLAQAKDAGGAIRIATLAPRTSQLVKGFVKIDRNLQAATNGAWKLKIYASGVAGDEKDTLRKIRVGQLDSTVVTSVGLSLVHKELAVMTSPGVIENYRQLERVQKAFNKEFEQKLADKGYGILGWGEIGMLRYFTKGPLTSPMDLKEMRPWVWPVSHTMKSTLKAIGATGVPLGVPEVYGALQTGMIDAVISTALAVVALQWHPKLNHVTLNTHGPLVGAMVIDNKRWKGVPEDVRKHVKNEVDKNYEGANADARKDDVKSLKKLLKTGYKGTKYSTQGQKDLKAIEKRAQDMLIGRVYSRELVDRVMKAARGS